MSRERRRMKLEAELRTLEADFELELVAALRSCADGRYGIFGQNEAAARASFSGSALQRLLGSERATLLARIGEIDALRASLGYVESHPLAERFLAVCARRGSNDPGEPVLARLLLDEIDAGKHL